VFEEVVKVLDLVAPGGAPAAQPAQEEAAEAEEDTALEAPEASGAGDAAAEE